MFRLNHPVVQLIQRLVLEVVQRVHDHEVGEPEVAEHALAHVETCGPLSVGGRGLRGLFVRVVRVLVHEGLLDDGVYHAPDLGEQVHHHLAEQLSQVVAALRGHLVEVLSREGVFEQLNHLLLHLYGGLVLELGHVVHLRLVLPLFLRDRLPLAEVLEQLQQSF